MNRIDKMKLVFVELQEVKEPILHMTGLADYFPWGESWGDYLKRFKYI